MTDSQRLPARAGRKLTRAWRWVKKRASGLLPATILAIAGGALIATGLVFYFTWLVLKIPPTGTIPTPGQDGSSPFLDVLKVALAVAAGVGGAVALVVSYRRQRLAERDDAGRRSRYTSAAQQLGDPQAAVRLAGVYAMAHLADEWDEQRQQCVDVLCAYLRLPWAPAGSHTLEPNTTTTEHTWPDGTGQRKTTKTYAGRPGEHEVRTTILRVLNTHLQPMAGVDSAPGAVSWSDLDIDLTAATLPDADFSGAVFRGVLRLNRARFTSGARFGGTQFTGGAWFSDAQFTTGAMFSSALFDCDAAFGRAHFSGSAMFYGTKFIGGAWFNGAQFTEDATFTRALFTTETQFIDAEFTGEALFAEAQFIGTSSFTREAGAAVVVVTFSGAWFQGEVSLHGAKLPTRAAFASCAIPPRRAALAEAIYADDAVRRD